MAIVCALRGTSLDAYYSAGYKMGVPSDTSIISVGADAGALSGSLINMTNGTAKYINLSGVKNAGESRAFSILMRVKANYTGNPAGLRAMWAFGLGRNGQGSFMEMWHDTASKMIGFGRNQVGQGMFSSVDLGSWSATSGTYYDLVWTFTGDTSANGLKFYVDASNVGNATAANALTASWKSGYFNPISIGAAPDVFVNDFYLDEFVVWDSVIDPTSVTLVSGSGSLNGASRTSLVSVSNVEAGSFTAVAAGDLKTGVSATQAGVTVNGTYDGSDRHSDPGIANVADGVSYKSNSTTNNRTGTLVATTTNVVNADQIVARLLPFILRR